MGEWRKMYGGYLNNLYSSLNIIRQVKSMWMWWTGHETHVGEKSIQDFGGIARKRHH
jgi:hypothetical protein